jgi:hypothetical protein
MTVYCCLHTRNTQGVKRKGKKEPTEEVGDAPSDGDIVYGPTSPITAPLHVEQIISPPLLSKVDNADWAHSSRATLATFNTSSRTTLATFNTSSRSTLATFNTSSRTTLATFNTSESKRNLAINTNGINRSESPRGMGPSPSANFRNSQNTKVNKPNRGMRISPSKQTIIRKPRRFDDGKVKFFNIFDSLLPPDKVASSEPELPVRVRLYYS